MTWFLIIVSLYGGIEREPTNEEARQEVFRILRGAGTEGRA